MKILQLHGHRQAQVIETIPGIDEIAAAAQSSENQPTSDQIILQTHDGQFIVDENEIDQIDQIPPENLIYMTAEDGSIIQGEVVHVNQEHVTGNEEILDEPPADPKIEYMECEVTEEVITDDWVQTDGQECVQVTVDQLGTTGTAGTTEDEVTVPLPADQDEYTTSRPYPCDFCSRRFRKKANLMNHMIAHSNDRPHICNLCGARYMRRSDLLNHLKLHAYAPDDNEEPVIRSDPEDDYGYELPSPPPLQVGMQHSSSMVEEDEDNLLIPTTSHFKPTSHRIARKSRPRAGISTKLITKRTFSASGRALRKTQELVQTSYTEIPDDAPPRFPVTDDRKPCVCQKCGLSFAREKALASHLRIHGGDTQYECQTCGERFWDRTMLQDHVRQRHTASLIMAAMNSPVGPYKPLTADGDLDSSPDGSIDRQHYCDSCGKVFQKADQLKRHIKLAHGVREQPTFEPIDHIVRQRQQNTGLDGDDDDEEDNDNLCDENDAQEPLCCNVCGDTFAEPLDLLAHAEVHARSHSHKCQLCRESFADEAMIREHVQRSHSNELTETSCVICGKACKSQASLLKHAWDHSRERSSCCSKCGKSFHNKARLKRHMMSHRNKSVKCEICSEDFPDGRSLMNHRHSHTKSKQFPCNVCGKTFGSRSSQQIHLRIHSGERPYGCRFCWKAFADGGTLRKHERVHTGEKPYVCSVCPRAFNQRVVLREHIRSHHSAPDTKRGTTAQPYFCSVCSELFDSSIDLIQHLIQHSDMNTAMKREPPTFPRKYKRRRKLKPEELERMEQGKSRRKENNMAYVVADHSAIGIVEDEDPLNSPADVLLEYGAVSPSPPL